MNQTYPLAVSSWGDEERRAAIAVIESGNTTMGPKVREYEEMFAKMFGATYGVMSNSGSSANLLAVAATRYRSKSPVQAGSVAIVPAVSWATTYYPLTQYGLRLRFVDIDKDTLNFDLAALERAIDEDVSIIFAVNLLGNCNDYYAINRLIGDRSITLLEDNCESMGATFNGRSAGTFGQIGTFSSFFSHHISTMEGGMCLTDDEELYELMLSLRAHGWTRHLPESSKLRDPSVSGFYDLFQFIYPGYNLRPLEISGAIGIEQLRKFPSFVESRRANAARFLKLFSAMRGVRIQKEIGESSWFGFSVVLTKETNIDRDTVVAKLSAAGVETRPILAGNFYRHRVIQHLDHEPNAGLTNADEIHNRGFYVGNHHFDVSTGIDRFYSVMSDILDA